MKRYGNLWPRICSRDNIELAADNAIKRRRNYKDVKAFLSNRGKFIDILESELKNETYHFGELIAMTVREPKERSIHYPKTLKERILHHSMMNVITPLMKERFTADTYGSISGRGLHLMGKKLHKILADHPDWYYVQTDIHHFYASINHNILKGECRRLFKDVKLLKMLDTIIDIHSPGVAIGVYPSQYLSNLYLSRFDHWIKETLRCKYYFRYMDDMVFVVPSKGEAHNLLRYVTEKIHELKLEIKPSARIAPVKKGIDVCGYVFFPSHTRLRKSIKQKMKRYVKKYHDCDDKTFKRKLSSHVGWCKGGNCRNLVRVVLGDKYDLFAKNMGYKRLSEIKDSDGWFGLSRSSRISIDSVLDKEIVFFDFCDVVVKGEHKLAVKFAFPDDDQNGHFFLTKSSVIKDRLTRDKENLPFIATVKTKGHYYYYE